MDLTPETLLTILQWGISSSQPQIQKASQQLQSWQTQPEYHRLLQNFVGNPALPFETRWLAAIQLKNGIDRFWRKTAMHAISPSEKDGIRSKCIEIGIHEPDRRLALQNALFLAKIVRIDYPHDWPDAVRNVLQVIEESNEADPPSAHLSACLLLLLTMVKELSTARLMKTRRAFQSDGPSILRILTSVYAKMWHSCQSFLDGFSHDAHDICSQMEINLLCVRVLRRVLVAAFENPSRNDEVHEFWTVLSGHFERLIIFLRTYTATLPTEINSIIEKILLQIAKLHVAMVESHPSSFAQLPNAVMIARAHWNLLQELGDSFGAKSVDISVVNTSNVIDDEQRLPFVEKFGLKGLLLLRGCVKMVYNPTLTFKYQTVEDKHDRTISKETVKRGLLSEDLVRQMMEVTVTKFFVFRPSDLQRWAEDPSDWERQEEGEGDAWKYSIRICAEKLYLDLVLNHKDLLIGPLIGVFSRVASLENTDLLLKDSIYSAVGLSAPVLVGKLDFNNFMRSTLLPEIQLQQAGYNILRRRASIMVAQWSVVGGLEPSLVYPMFQYLLDPTQEMNDIVVRLSAGRQLKHAIDPYGTSSERLQPYIKKLLEQVMALVGEAELAETKIALIGTVQVLVQTMEEAISPFAQEIVNPLPIIWQEAEDEYLLKQVIIGLLSELFKAMKAQSSRFHSLILPLISSALSQENEARVYLLDDAVDLWASVLAQVSLALIRWASQSCDRRRFDIVALAGGASLTDNFQAPDSSTEILALWPNIFPLFETADENLRRGLEITDSYAILFPSVVVQDGAPQVWAAFASLMREPLRRDARVSICEVAERFLTVSQTSSDADGFLRVVRSAEDAGFLSDLVKGLRSAFESHQDPSPRAPKTEINGIVETHYWRILSRIMIRDPRIFIELLESMQRSGTLVTGVEQSLNDLLTELFSHYDNLSSPDASKLIALSLVSLLKTSSANLDVLIGGRLQELITLWTATIHECTYEGKDNLVWHDMESLKPEENEVPEQARRRELEFIDPIRRCNIRHEVAEAIRLFSNRFGHKFDETIESIDTDVMGQFQSLDLFRGA